MKHAPYLTDNTTIPFHAQDGTSPLGYEIEYDGRKNIKELESNLLSLGYLKGP